MGILLSKIDCKLDNKNSRQRNFLKKHINSILFLILLTVIVSLITYWRVLIQIDIGPLSDSVDFFTDALVFSGHGFGYSDLLRPPLFPFITSIFIRMGYHSINTIFAVDGGFFVFGIIGFYLLLKLRFNDLESFLGGLLFSTFPIVLTILGTGFSDLASVSFSIWGIYFLGLAVKKDSKFFYLAFPFFMFAFLTRYNNALLIFPIFLYILINKKKVNYKNVIVGIIASILVIIPVFLFFYQKFGNIIYPFMSFSSTSTIASVSAESASYDSNIFFFLLRFPAYVGPQGFFTLFIIGLGVVSYLLYNILIKNRLNKNLFEIIKLKLLTDKFKWIIFVILSITFLVSFGKVIYMVNEVLFFVLAYLFYDLTKTSKVKTMDIHLLFLAWFMVFFIFHSIFIIKDNRYFVVMAPPVAYFMILGLSEISKRIKLKIRNRNIVFPLIAVVLTAIILLSTVSMLPLIFEANNDEKIANEDMGLTSQWLENYDPNYKNKNIYSDLWPNFSWYLQTNVKTVPVFKDNKLYYGGVKDNNFTQQDSNAYNSYLTKNNAYYYISVRQGLNLTSYKPIKQFGIVTIYKKI